MVLSLILNKFDPISSKVTRGEILWSTDLVRHNTAVHEQIQLNSSSNHIFSGWKKGSSVQAQTIKKVAKKSRKFNICKNFKVFYISLACGECNCSLYGRDTTPRWELHACTCIHVCQWCYLVIMTALCSQNLGKYREHWSLRTPSDSTGGVWFVTFQPFPWKKNKPCILQIAERLKFNT